MNTIARKTLALLLSASLFSSYAVPSYAAETVTGEKTVTGTDSAATSNQTTGVYQVENTGSLTVTGNAVFDNNSSSVDDGAAINNSGSLTVDNSQFNNNSVNYDGGAGGALFLKGNNSINNSSFDGNSVTGNYGGGALYLSNKAGSLTLTNSSFTNNTATNFNEEEDAAGGAVALLKKAELDNVTFTGNKTVSSVDLGLGGGGAMFIGAEGKVEIEDSRFTENVSATDGGAIATRTQPPADNKDASLDIEETIFEKNIASGKGGAIWNNFYNSKEIAGYVNVEDSTFAQNSAQQGGAIFNDQNGKIRVEDGTFNNNLASTAGGAIYNNETLVISGNSTFSGNKVTTDGYDGGAIYNKGSLTIEQGATFTGNESDWGGALFLEGTNSITGASFTSNKVEGTDVSGGALYLGKNAAELTLKDSTFTANSATNTGSTDDAAGGAASLMEKATVDNVTFTNNQVLGNNNDNRGGGGALFLGAEGKITIANSTFTSNHSSSVGGAIATRDENAPAVNIDASLDISNSTFTGNTANGNGGAIWNNFYNSTNATGSAYITNSTFSNNKADGEGGAIYNASVLTLAGTNTFTGNTAAGVANDIHNLGTLNIGGTASFEGGITGTGSVNVTDGATVNLGLGSIEADSIAFANGTTLGVTLASDTMGNLKANSVTVGENTTDTANLIVTVSTDFATADEVTQQLTNGTEVTNGTFAMADVTNALYNVSFDATTNEVTAVRKSQEEQTEAITEAGGNANNLEVIDAFTSSSDLGSAKANEVADIINTLAQTDTVAAVQATTALAPEAASAKQAVQGSVTREVFNVLQTRMNDAASKAPSMYALEDGENLNDEKNYSVWLQGLANKSHKENTSDSAAFTGRSTGLSFGVDTQLDDNTLVGLGYAYTHTNVSSFLRHDRIDGNTFFLYGQYRPSQFYVQGTLAYGDSKYEEEKYVSSVEVDANYHVKTYAAQATAGYDVNEWLSPNFALRYMNLQQESYTDGADQSVSASQDNYLTAVLGVDLQTQKRVSSTLSLLPRFHAGISYDLLSDEANSRVTLPNASGYNVTGERLHRLSFEAGASVTAQVADNVEASLGYEGNFREDYNSHTGMLKLRYLF